MFGTEYVAIQSQTYREILIPILLCFELFGKEFKKYSAYVVMQTKKRVLFHLPLSAVAKRIFTIAALCAFELEFENNNNLTVRCCGKVNIFMENSKKNICNSIDIMISILVLNVSRILST